MAIPRSAGTIRMATYGTFSYTLGIVRYSSVEQADYALSNVLEVKLSVITEQKACKGDEELRKWRVHIDEVRGFDVFSCKASKVHFVEPKEIGCDIKLA